jgi:hypothetical protein
MLRLLRQRVVMAAQKAQADVLLHWAFATHYRGGAAHGGGTNGAHGALPSAAQARAWACGDFGVGQFVYYK